MKKKDFDQIKTKSIADLVITLASKKEDLAIVRLGIVSGQEKNLKKAFNLRKEIAKILTVVREKEIMERKVTK